MNLRIRFLRWIASKLNFHPIWREEGVSLYMARYHPGKSIETDPWFLHNILLADGDGHHNHPYSWQFSIVLSGSYEEEVLIVDPYAPLCETKQTGPGIWETPLGKRIHARKIRWFNWIRNSTYHRITKLNGEVWTLFVRGPKHGDSWGFWEPGFGHIHNEEYKNPTPPNPIFWSPTGWENTGPGWYFSEETWAWCQGPFKTREECAKELGRYGHWLETGEALSK